MGVAVIGIIIPSIFAVLTILISIGFCCARSCCNRCGERVATEKYSKKQVIWLRVGFAIWTMFMIVMCVLTIMANHSVSTGLNNSVDNSDSTFKHVLTVQDSLNEVSTPFEERITRVRTLQWAMEGMPTTAEVQNTYGPQVFLNWGLIKSQADLSTDINAIYTSTLALDGITPMQAAVHVLQPTIAAVVDQEADFVTFSSSASTLSADIDSISQASVPSAEPVFTSTANAAVQAKDASLALRASASLSNTAISKGFAASQIMEDLSILSPSVTDVRARLEANDDSQCAADRAVLDDLRSQLSGIISATAASGTLGTTLQDTLNQFSTPYETLLLPYFRYAGLSIDAATASAQDAQTQFAALDADAEFHKLITFDVSESSSIRVAARSVSALQALKLSLAEATSTAAVDRPQLQALFDTVTAAIANFTANDTLSRSVADVWSDAATRTQAIDTTGMDALLTAVNYTVVANAHLALIPIETRFLATEYAVMQAQHDSSSTTAAQASRDSLHAALLAARDALQAAVITSARDGVDDIAQEYESVALAALQPVSDALSTYVTALEALNTTAIAHVGTNTTHIDTLSQRQAQVDTLASINLATLRPDGDAYKLANLYQLSSSLLHDDLVALLAQVDATCSSGTLSASASTDVKNNLLYLSSPVPTGSNSVFDLDHAYKAVFATGDTAADDLATVISSLTFALTSGDLPTALPTDFKTTSTARTAPSTTYSSFNDNFTEMENTKGSLTNGDMEDIASNTGSLRTASSTADASFDPIEAGLVKVSTGTVLPSSPAHHVINYLHNALIVNTNFQTLVDDDRDNYITYLAKMAGLRDNVPSDLDEMISDMDVRVNELHTTLDDLFSFADNYYSFRHDVKREGYTLDEQRLIIIDVAILLVTVLVVFGLLAAMLARHKCLMMMVMILIPLVALLFAFSGVHFTPGLLFVDGCRDSSRNVVGFLGNGEIDESAINGVISYLGESLTAPVTVGEVYNYLYNCGATPKPEFLQIMLDVSPTSPGLTKHDMADFRQEVNDTFTSNDLVMAPELLDTFTILSQTSTVLADKSHEVGGLISCETVQPLLLKLVDDSMCYELAGSVAILGCLLFLHALCLVPGLILGCRAFKRFNIRNSTEYKRVIRHADGVVIIDGGTEERTEVVKLKHREMGLKTGVSLGQLKGFGEGTVVNFSYHNDAAPAPPPPSNIPPARPYPNVSTSRYNNEQSQYPAAPAANSVAPRGNSSFSALRRPSQTNDVSYTPRGMNNSAHSTPVMGPAQPLYTDLPQVSNSRSQSRSVSVNNTPQFMSTPATRSQNHIELSRLR
jgi:hypothetical protein